jgi:hypothetical protein
LVCGLTAAGVISFVVFEYGHGFLGTYLVLVVVVQTPLMQLVEVTCLVMVPVVVLLLLLSEVGLVVAGVVAPPAAVGAVAAGLAAAGVAAPPAAVGAAAAGVEPAGVLVDSLPSTHS